MIEAPWPEKIKLLRELKGWTQAELAQRIGLHPGTVSHWESGFQIPIKYARKWINDELAKLSKAVSA